MSKSHNERYNELKEYYAQRVDTPKPPVETGDTVMCDQLAGIHTANYPIKGTVKRIEPRGVGTHNVMADWFIRVYFEESECKVYNGTTEVFFVGGTRRSWDENPLHVPDN